MRRGHAVSLLAWSRCPAGSMHPMRSATSFEGPGRAIQCAAALREELAGIGVGIRAGLHTGELELRGDDVGGLAVHIAARVMAAAQPGEILVSRTVRDLAAGADVTLEDRGMHLPKGVDGDWQLHAVARP